MAYGHAKNWKRSPPRSMACEIVVFGFAWNPETREHDKRIEYIARSRMEASRWINCNRDYLKDPQIAWSQNQ